MRKDRGRLGIFMFGTIPACVMIVVMLYLDGDIGLPKSRLEADLRTSQGIEADWSVEGMASHELAAFVAYPADRSDCTVSIYVNRPGLSFGYFFRSGGSFSQVENGIGEYTLEGCDERAFLSMNRERVERLEIDDGNSVQVTELDSSKPFAIVLPVNTGNIQFYDVNGAVVEVQKGRL